MTLLETLQKQFPAGFLDYPNPSEKDLRWTYQHHWRGSKNVHGDIRFAQDDHLIGFTLAVQLPGIDVPGLDEIETASVERAHKYALGNPEKFKIHPRTGDFATRRTADGVERATQVLSFPKANQPLDWLTFEGVSPPGKVGATTNLPGVIDIIDRGTYTPGARKASIWEVFIDGKVFKGRYFWRPLALGGTRKNILKVTLPPSEEQTVEGVTLELIRPDSQLPNVLAKSSREERPWVPPQGWSALPPELERRVPNHLRYWTKEREVERRKLRDELFDRWKTEGLIAELERGELEKHLGDAHDQGTHGRRGVPEPSEREEQEGSLNYEARRAEGWVEGGARYASTEPHHVRSESGAWNYVQMHNEKREKLLSLIIDGEYQSDDGSVHKPEGSKTLKAKISAVEKFPKISDDPGRDYEAAFKAGTVKTYLQRDDSGVVQDVRIYPGEESGFEMTSDGWDEVASTEDEWKAEYYSAELVREPRTEKHLGGAHDESSHGRRRGGTVGERIRERRNQSAGFRLGDEAKRADDREKFYKEVFGKDYLTNAKASTDMILGWTGGPHTVGGVKMRVIAADFYGRGVEDDYSGAKALLRERWSNGVTDVERESFVAEKVLSEEAFEREHGSSTTVYRGVNVPEEIADRVNAGEEVEVGVNVLSSWSLSKDIAGQFKQVPGFFIVETEAKKEDVWGYFKSGSLGWKGNESEQEVILGFPKPRLKVKLEGGRLVAKKLAEGRGILLIIDGDATANWLHEKPSEAKLVEVEELQKHLAGAHAEKGGPGSGNFGHPGRPGEVGGSGPTGGGKVPTRTAGVHGRVSGAFARAKQRLEGRMNRPLDPQEFKTEGQQTRRELKRAEDDIRRFEREHRRDMTPGERKKLDEMKQQLADTREKIARAEDEHKLAWIKAKREEKEARLKAREEERAAKAQARKEEREAQAQARFNARQDLKAAREEQRAAVRAQRTQAALERRQQQLRAAFERRNQREAMARVQRKEQEKKAKKNSRNKRTPSKTNYGRAILTAFGLVNRTLSRAASILRPVRKAEEVEPSGPESASLLIVGDGPGEADVQAGAPFAGISGRFLRDVLASLGADAGKIRFDNIFRNRREKLEADEVEEEGHERAVEAFELPGSKAVLLMGQTAIKGFLGRTAGLRGKTLIVTRPDSDKKLVVFPTFHPALIVRTGRKGSRNYRAWIEHLKRALRFVKLIPGDSGLESQAIEETIKLLAKGGPGSGFFGHVGRPGERGGSAPAEGAAKPSEAKKPKPAPSERPRRYGLNPDKDADRDGVDDESRVGVPADKVPPPPTIPRLPNLTDKEREIEDRFAKAFEEDPDALVRAYREKLAKGEIGDAPNIYNTDDAKLLSPDYNPQGVSEEELKAARAENNILVHQTANAVAKRAFLERLDELEKLPPDQRTVLVTSGGVAAGKGYALGKVPQAQEIASKVGAVWDAAGEQNATENPWILKECERRGIRPIFAFVHADPVETWENPQRGVIERANKKGRMVDAELFADSYARGAKNFDAFQRRNKDKADFIVIDNRGTPKLLDSVPQEALELRSEAIRDRALKALSASKAKPYVKAGGSIGTRVFRAAS